jgi:hypothetical protein
MEKKNRPVEPPPTKPGGNGFRPVEPPPTKPGGGRRLWAWIKSLFR